MPDETHSKVRRRKRGRADKQAFTELHKRVFEQTISTAQEIRAALDGGSTLHPSSKSVNRVDFVIAVQQCAKELPKDLKKYFKRLIAADDTLGQGTLNRLILELAPKFLAAQLWPMSRFVCESVAWAEQVSKKRQNLAAMRQDPVIASSPPKQDDGIRHFGPEGHWVNAREPVAEFHPVRPADRTTPLMQDEQDDAGLDEGFERQELAVS
jgi:hypothetical protein